MKAKRNQSSSRRERQLRNWGAAPIVLTNFPGREIWRGTLADLFAAPVVCGMPEPLLMSPTSTDPVAVGQEAIRRQMAALSRLLGETIRGE